MEADSVPRDSKDSDPGFILWVYPFDEDNEPVAALVNASRVWPQQQWEDLIQGMCWWRKFDLREQILQAFEESAAEL